MAFSDLYDKQVRLLGKVHEKKFFVSLKSRSIVLRKTRDLLLLRLLSGELSLKTTDGNVVVLR